MRGQAIDALIVTAGKVTDTWAFYLDYAGAKVGQLTGAKGRGNRMFEADDGDAVEGAAS
ncbi:hypothetical protein D3C78_876700 [compost metagenome]